MKSSVLQLGHVHLVDRGIQPDGAADERAEGGQVGDVLKGFQALTSHGINASKLHPIHNILQLSA